MMATIYSFGHLLGHWLDWHYSEPVTVTIDAKTYYGRRCPTCKQVTFYDPKSEIGVIERNL